MHLLDIRSIADNILQSQGLDGIIGRLYMQLVDSFRSPGDSDDASHLVEALRMMNTPELASRMVVWSQKHSKWLTPEGGANSLLEKVLNSKMNFSDRRTTACLVLGLAYPEYSVPPRDWIEIGKFLADFLDHFFALEARGEDQDGPIADAYEVLRHLGWGFSLDLDFANGHLLEGIRRSVKPNKPTRLRCNVIHFIFWLVDESEDLIKLEQAMQPDQWAEFSSDCAILGAEIAKDGDSRSKDCYFDVSLRMANSEIWRPDMVLAHGRTLERMPSGYMDSSLSECLMNEELIPSLQQLNDGAMITRLWLAVVWGCSFERLDNNLIDVIRAATLDVLRREGESAVKGFGSVITAKENTLLCRSSAAEYGESARRRQEILQELNEGGGRTHSTGGLLSFSPFFFSPSTSST